MQRNRHGWLSIRGSARQGKMQHKQGRDYPPVPAMPEVAVHGDGGPGRPAQEAARPATTTAHEAALPVRVARMFTPPPPRFSGSRNPLHPAYLPLHSAPAPIERAPSGPRSPSATYQRGLSLFGFPVPANPAGFRPDGPLPLGTDVTVRRLANGRWATPALTPGATLEVTHVQP